MKDEDGRNLEHPFCDHNLENCRNREDSCCNLKKGCNLATERKVAILQPKERLQYCNQEKSFDLENPCCEDGVGESVYSIVEKKALIYEK
jgi:hypothetical protein